MGAYDLETALRLYKKKDLKESFEDHLIGELLKAILDMKKTLAWYGDEKHVLDSWYDRKDPQLPLAEKSNCWAEYSLRDSDLYVEDGDKALDMTSKYWFIQEE